MMKKIFFIIALALSTASLFAQAPEKMSYQAVIRDASNTLVTNQIVGIQISILQGSASGTAVYVETQSPLTNINGLASMEIGAGSVISGTFSTIDWGNGPYFVQTEIDPTGGASYTVTGTSQLMSVPYALYAKTAGNITEYDTVHWKINNNDISYKKGNVGIGTSSPTSKLEIVGDNTDNDGNITSGVISIQNNNYSRFKAATFSNTFFRNTQVQGIRGRGTMDNPQDVLPGDRVFGTYSNVYANGGFLSTPIASIEHFVGESAAASGALTFSTLAPNEALRIERLRINEYGNVGIGTSSPSSKLEIVGDNTDNDGNITSAVASIQNNNYSRFRASTFSNTFFRNTQVQGIRGRGTMDNPQDVLPGDRVFGTYSNVYANGGFLSTPIASIEHFVGDSVAASGVLTFSTLAPNEALRTERLRIDEQGNVGIGTLAPKARLQVADGDIYMEDINSGIIMKSPNGQCWRMTVDNSGNPVFTLIICP